MVEEFAFAGIPGIVDRSVPADEVWIVDAVGRKLGVIDGLALPRLYERNLSRNPDTQT